MEILIFEFSLLILFSFGVGFIASMIGISGGAFKIPFLIIVFGLGAELAAASSLLSALFVAVVCTVVFYRTDTRLICHRVGLLFVMTTIPGAYIGIVLRTIVADTQLLQMVFGIILFPVALKLLLVVSDVEFLQNEEKCAPIFSHLNRKKLIVAIFSAFFAGVLAGLLGLGGGTIIVPLLCILLEFPLVAAAATSMFTMIFTSAAGSIMNYTYLIHTENLTTFLYYGTILGIGLVIGGLIGPKYAYRMNTVQLQRFFGFILIFPLVKMMSLGHLWLTPNVSDYILATLGDVMIWLMIGIPAWFLSSYQIQRRRLQNEDGFSTTPLAD
jgi:uncharacterized membrane protein YfcA